MLNEIKYVTITLDILKDNLSLIRTNNIPVWRKNKSGVYVVIPLERLEQFLGENNRTDITFSITEEWEDIIKINSINAKKKSIINQNKQAAPDSSFYREKRIEILNMSPEQRDKRYQSVLYSLQKIESADKVLNEDVLINLIEAVSDAFVLNKSSFEENYEDNENISSDHIKAMARNTTSLVQSIMGIFKNNSAANNFINMLGEKSTGSTIDHMNSVFLIFLPLCYFYNSYFTKGKIAKIRSEYKTKYYKYYSKLVPDNPPESLEDVFNGGMREIPIDKLLQFSIGALLHDIGKIDNIDYFEGEGLYDRKIIMKHAPISYNMIVKTREFDSEVALLAALHHEYYNDAAGYGISKILFPENTRKYKTHQYCLTYDIADIKNGRALAYVPIKLLEIVDVFDALTDKTRRYREKEFTIDEALELMKSDFIDKSLKIDPILFTIFLDYINNHSILKDETLLNRVMLK
ncbi:MAG TPA: HD domain-containing protein [Spirochaetota bacterium]|nr:HD domain-containing protein [Spirochaetota bacterium]